ncbi:MAG: YIP1 family protein [Anaerolineae bacterium]
MLDEAAYLVRMACGAWGDLDWGGRPMFGRLVRLLREPDAFAEAAREEGYLEPLWFLIGVMGVLAVLTPATHLLGWASTDVSAATQAQILAWRFVRSQVNLVGARAYVAEAGLILILGVALAPVLATVIHLLYRLLGGKGPWRYAWASVCYGLGPSALAGFVPYWSLFVAVWSLLLQFYLAPKVLYRAREGRALVTLAVIVAATLLEFALAGTTVGFGPM